MALGEVPTGQRPSWSNGDWSPTCGAYVALCLASDSAEEATAACATHASHTILPRSTHCLACAQCRAGRLWGRVPTHQHGCWCTGASGAVHQRIPTGGSRTAHRANSTHVPGGAWARARAGTKFSGVPKATWPCNGHTHMASTGSSLELASDTRTRTSWLIKPDRGHGA